MKITNDVHMIDGTDNGHIYFIKGNQNIIIDTGFPGKAKQIIDEINKIGVDINDVSNILLTHHDIDHIGNAKDLQDASKAKLWASKEDSPYITGEKKRPGLKKIIQTIIKHKLPNVDNYYGEEMPLDIKVIKAPGHTPGHVMFLYKDVLFIGDLFKVNVNKIQQMPGFMNWNQEEYKKSLNLLKDIEFTWICPSHGNPIKKLDLIY